MTEPTKVSEKDKKQVYAIVRVDLYLFDLKETPFSNKITVTKIVDTLDVAEMEVLRLSRLKDDKKSVYFWQATRYVSERP